jgi:hypothetical protein
MKKFTVNCNFGGQIAPFIIYVGTPKDDHHPLHFQADWLSKTRGGTIPPEVTEALTKLQALSKKNNVSLEDLCVYALGSAQQDKNKDEDNDDDI